MTSSPKKEVPLDKETQLDKNMADIEQSIHETERRLKEMVNQQRKVCHMSRTKTIQGFKLAVMHFNSTQVKSIEHEM